MILYCPNPTCKAILMKNAPIIDPDRPALCLRCAKCESDVEIRVEAKVVRKGRLLGQVVESNE